MRHIVAAAVLLALTFTLGVLASAQAPAPGTRSDPPRGRGAAPQAPAGAFVAYPPRPPGDPAAIERGKAIFGVNCTFCHGPDARGGDGGGPNLLRSSVVL